jgi:hypothetical protein
MCQRYSEEYYTRFLPLRGGDNQNINEQGRDVVKYKMRVRE